MTGLQLLFADLRTKPHCECYLRGAARMNRGLLKMHIVAVVASGPTEEGLAMLCEDDRPFLQVKMSSFTIEQEFIGDLSVDVYTYAWFVGLGAMRVSVSLRGVCWTKWKEHPWCMFAGDATVKLEQKLNELSALEELDGQMWACPKFMQQWSTTVADLAHASAAQTKKYHPYFGHEKSPPQGGAPHGQALDAKRG